MDSLWLPIIVIAAIALVFYQRRRSAQGQEQRKVDEFRQLQAKVSADDRTRAPAASLTRPPAVAPPAGGGLLQDAADRAAGLGYERATNAIEEQTSELTRARQEAERAADRLAGRAEEAMAAVKVAASPHGGAVPGDGSHDCPAGYPIKGNMPSQRYHEPGQLSYERTIPEVCFQSVAAAEAAGFISAQDDPGMRGQAATGEAAEAVAEEIEVVGGRGGTGIVAGAAAAEAVLLREDDVDVEAEVEDVVAIDGGDVPPGAVRGDGSRDCPPTYPIKAKEQERRYSMPGSGAYAMATPDLCFSSVDSAEAAGYSSMR